MQHVYLRFSTEKQDWRLQFDNGEVLHAKDVFINCPCQTVSRREKGITKFYILVPYTEYKWTSDMLEIHFFNKTETLNPTEDEQEADYTS
jgi:hypothetical protein